MTDVPFGASVFPDDKSCAITEFLGNERPRRPLKPILRGSFATSVAAAMEDWVYRQ